MLSSRAVANYYLQSPSPTNYAKAQGALTGEYWKTNEGRNMGFWWLRTSGENLTDAIYRNADGITYMTEVNDTGLCVRPALWIDLDSGIF